MRPGRRHDQRPHRVMLAAHLAQVRRRRARAGAARVGSSGSGSGSGGPPLSTRTALRSRPAAATCRPSTSIASRARSRREHERRHAFLHARLRHRERSLTRSHTAVERELAKQRMCIQTRLRQLLAGCQHPARQREVQTQVRPSARPRERG